MGHNLLIDALPETVEVGGAAVPIRTGFRVGVLFELLMWDGAVGDAEKVAQALRLYYRARDMPGDLEAGYRAAVGFYAGGVVREGKDGGRRLYCFERDADAILAAMWDQYGLDLTRETGLHWWVFRALFAGLGPQHEISRRMGLRAVRLGSVRDREERARLAQLQARVRLDGDGDAAQMAERAGAVFR